jgi:hypothetical protein
MQIIHYAVTDIIDKHPGSANCLGFPPLNIICEVFIVIFLYRIFIPEVYILMCLNQSNSYIIPHSDSLPHQ